MHLLYRAPHSLRSLLWTGSVSAVLCAGLAAAEDTPPAPQKAAAPEAAKALAPGIEFEQYQLVLLRRGPKAEGLSEAELKKLQAGHLAHLGRMAESGKMVAAGPFGNQQDASYRGLCLYRTATVEEARQLAEADPAVQAGRLRVEVMTWYTEKGYIAFPKAPPVERLQGHKPRLTARGAAEACGPRAPAPAGSH